MILFEIAMIILAIGVLIYLATNFFWIVSLFLIYRTITSILPFTFLVDKIGMESHLLYFIIMTAISIGFHFGIIILTRDWIILRFIFYILMALWVLYYYDLPELLFFRDWFEMKGVEFSAEWFKEQLKTLVTTSPGEYIQMMIDFLNGLASDIEKIYDKIFNRK